MSSRTAARAASVAAVLVLSLLAACTDGTIEPPPPSVPVASVQVLPLLPSVTVGEQLTLVAMPRAANGDVLQRPVTWSSENEALATVTAAGVVTTLAAGEVGIRATSEGKYGVALVTISPIPPAAVDTVRLSVDDEIVLAWDGETTISAIALDAHGNVLQGRTVQWHSTKPSIVAVNHGTLNAIRPGVATVSAIVEGVAASVGVRVNEAPITSLAIEGSTGLEVGEVVPFGSKITRANGEALYGPVSWSSSAPGILRVDYEDLTGATIAALAEGTATITIARDGVQASVTLSVTTRSTHDLIYNRWSGTNSEIFVMGLAVDGTIPLKLNAGNVSREPSPSPDGTQIVFAVTQPTITGELQNDLYIVNRNGMNMRWLTRAPGIEEQPEWSPDGTRILFHGVVDGKSDLFVINVDGTGLTNLTAGLPAAMVDKREPAWSRDGSRIAFIGVMGTEHKVWTISANGANAKQITTDVGFDRFPTFSPDGSQIAFTRHNITTPSYGNDVMIVSSQGGTPTRLALPGDQINPAWSPDGGYIAVNGSAVAGQGQVEIWTLRPDGSGLKLRTVNPAWGGGFNPAWIVR